MILAARWVVPVTAPPIRDGAVAIEHGRIGWVGPRSAAPAGAVTDFGDAAIVPGLVNAHTHLELTVMRGFLEELPFRPWIVRLTRARAAVLTDAHLLASAKLGIAEGLLAGITTYADTTASGVTLEAMGAMGVRGIAYQEVFGPDPAQSTAALDALRRRLDELRDGATGRVTLGVSPHAPYTVSDPLFAGVARLAREDGLPLAIHVAESEEETLLVRDGAGPFADALRERGIAVAPRGRSPIDLLERVGALTPRTLLIHAVRTDDTDLARIAVHDCAIAHCPVSNAKLGHGIAPLDQWLQRGVRVGLGTDSVAANNRMDLLDEGRVAVLLQRARAGRPDTLSAARALGLATMGSAAALGMSGRIGSLEAGKEADVAVFSLGGPRGTPAHDPEGALVWALAGRPATFVLVGGEVRVAHGALVADATRDRDMVTEAASALAAWSAAGG
jgi:cytosine/adenosine deaminase-related metal-dependent hydrolase